MKHVVVVGLVFWTWQAWTAQTYPIVKPYRSLYEYGEVNTEARVASIATTIINDTNLFRRSTTWTSNTISQVCEWGTEANYPSLFIVNVSFRFEETNNINPVFYWDYTTAVIYNTSWGYGDARFTGSGGWYRWMKSKLMLKILPDPVNLYPPTNYWMVMAYSPFNFWSPSNQAPEVFGRFKFTPAVLPLFITIDPKEYKDWEGRDIYRINGQPAYPSYWFYSSMRWYQWLNETNTFGTPIGEIPYPFPDVCNPPWPETAPQNVKISFDRGQQGMAQKSTVFTVPKLKKRTFPPVPDLKVHRTLEQSRNMVMSAESEWPSPESWTKTIEFTGSNCFSHFLLMASSNLVNWELMGLMDNVQSNKYSFVDTNSSDGVKFYKVIPLD